MSDRIDELVRRKRLIVCRDCSCDIPCTSCAPGQQFDKLAAIAREAEARADEAEAERIEAVNRYERAEERADEAELALAAEREVSATYARVGDEMKSRGEARIKELEGERDTLDAALRIAAQGLAYDRGGTMEGYLGNLLSEAAAAREAVRDATRR